MGKDDYFSCAAGRIFFRHLPHHYKEENMADVKVPQRLEPREIVKLLVALRRALKSGVA
jgi:hypothetical protein